MLAAESNRELAVVEQAGFGREKFGDDLAETAVHGVNGGQGVNADLFVRLELKFFVVELEIAAGCQDCGGAVARALLVRGGALERHWENYGARGFVPGIFLRDTAEVVGRDRGVSAHRRFMRPWEDFVSPFADGTSCFYVTCGEKEWQKNKGAAERMLHGVEWQRSRERPGRTASGLKT